MIKDRFPRYWRLDGEAVVPCTGAEHAYVRKDASRFLLCKTHIEPGFTIQTQFVGVQMSAKRPPELYRTSVFSDLGESVRNTRTHEDAALMHVMEVQRIRSVVERNRWNMIADAP